MDTDIRRFWELEEVPEQTVLTNEEKQVVAHFDSTTKQDENGRFIVELPRRKPTLEIGFSMKQAEQRFVSQERRLQRSPELAKQYSEFFKEFRDLGHLEVVPADQIHTPCSEHYYLPHHAVFKESSSTTKLRVVFDASAKTSTGISLNDTLMVGPMIQQNVYDLLLRFRFYKYGYTADVAKMYRQVVLSPGDRDLHRILWRDSPSMPMQHFRMTRVTYGIASSCYHATRALQECAKLTNDESVAETIVNDFYVCLLYTSDAADE